MKRIIMIFFVATCLFACKKEEKQSVNKPSDVSNLTVVPTVGGVTVKWDLPTDKNLLYVEVRYMKKGQLIIENISSFTNFVEITGLLNKFEYEFEVQAFNVSKDDKVGGAILKSAKVKPIKRGINITYNKINVTPSMATCFLQEPSEGPLANLFDNNLSTYFHSAYSVASVGPHYVTVTFPEETTLGQVKFFNRQGRGTNTDGRPTSISLSTSADGTNWSTAWTSGTLPTPPDVEVSSTFDKPYTSKRFRVSFLATARSSVYVALAEMSFYKADLTDLEVQAEQSY